MFCGVTILFARFYSSAQLSAAQAQIDANSATCSHFTQLLEQKDSECAQYYSQCAALNQQLEAKLDECARLNAECALLTQQISDQSQETAALLQVFC